MANAYTIKETPESTDSVTISDVSGAIFKATLGSLPGTSSFIGGYVDPPVYSDSDGIKGQYSFDADYIYMCIADNSWDRFPVSWDAWGTSAPENPVVLSATVDVSGEILTLVFDRNVFQGSTYLDSDFNLDASVSGSDIGISYQSGDGTRTHIYSISTVIGGGETVNIDYNGRANGLEDLSGNDLQSILSMTVTNLSEDLYSDIIFWDGFEGTITGTTYESTNYDYPAFHTGIVDPAALATSAYKKVGEKGLYLYDTTAPSYFDFQRLTDNRGRVGVWFESITIDPRSRNIIEVLNKLLPAEYYLYLQVSGSVGSSLNLRLRYGNITRIDSDFTVGVTILGSGWNFYEIAWDLTTGDIEVYFNSVLKGSFSYIGLDGVYFDQIVIGESPHNGDPVFGAYDNLMVSTDPNRDLYALALLEAYPG